MVELDQFKFKLNQYKEPMEELGMSLELERKKARMEELESCWFAETADGLLLD